MDKESKKITEIFLRYLIIILIGANLKTIYDILTPITTQTLKIILSIFTKVHSFQNIIFLPNSMIEIIPACVAGSAFFLLLILALSTADIKIGKRTKIIILSIIALFVLNITRILILVPIIGTIYFEPVHWIFWHLISTIFIVLIWISLVKKYKIKSIPVYSDIKYLISNIKPTKKSKRKKKNN